MAYNRGYRSRGFRSVRSRRPIRGRRRRSNYGFGGYSTRRRRPMRRRYIGGYRL